MSENRSHVIETTDSSFQADAIERSREVPVVVDFWAEWCGPCRRLGPILENLAREYEGQFVLVKADTERCPGVAAGFGVPSIPSSARCRSRQSASGSIA
jgi:putative thioredoxin